MTQNIIHLPHDPHREAQLLMPWYVTGELSTDEANLVLSHLEGCADCQADLRTEQSLHREVRDLPIEVERPWALMTDRLHAAPRRQPTLASRAAIGRHIGGGGRGAARWAMAAVAVILLFVLASVSAVRLQSPAPYQTLSAPQSLPAGNIVIVFRPDTTEAQIRLVLKDAHARLVGGPTAADAYILLTPTALRVAAIQRLRGDRSVILAEPIDPGEAP